MFHNRIFILLLTMSALTQISPAAATVSPADQCRYVAIREFADFTTEASTNANETVLTSPIFPAPISWNELIVSWNAATPQDAWIKVEARAIYPDHQTKYYTMGDWSLDAAQHPRQSVLHQKDGDGTVKEDTMILKRAGGNVQLRVTLAGPNKSAIPQLKYMGLSFCDSAAVVSPLPANHAVWGKIVPTTERSQNAYPEEQGWCSPTSLTMVLTRWGEILHRPELTADVPVVAGRVYDHNFGTGNWPFNAAYAGSFPGMRAYITRFSDISELEDWIAAGIPVVISAPWHMLADGRPDTGSGHLTVCIGFTENGDVVINDPATNLKKGQKVRHIYKREKVIKAWKESQNTVYLVYPETVQPPTDRFGHWDKP